MDRRVTFLELFFDLVFVVIVAQLAHHLATHPTPADLGWFAFLFFAVWSSWLDGTMYHELHATNDVSIRVFTFVQMGFVSLMAVFVGDVPGDGSAGFAMAYGANAAVLSVMWFRTGLHDPSHRPASNPYAAGYIASAPAFAASAFPPPPRRRHAPALAARRSTRIHVSPRPSGPCTRGPRPAPQAHECEVGLFWRMRYGLQGWISWPNPEKDMLGKSAGGAGHFRLSWRPVCSS